jgi:hypothetical protein
MKFASVGFGQTRLNEGYYWFDDAAFAQPATFSRPALLGGLRTE